MGGPGDPLLPTQPFGFTATPPFKAKVPGDPLAAEPGGDSATALGRAPCSHGARPRAPPTRAVGLGRPPTRTRVGSARASAAARRPLLGRYSGAAAGRMPRCGARRPSQATRARRPQKFGSGSVGSEMQPKARFPPQPRADKHAQARTQTSPRPALAAAGSGGVREEPGDQTGSLPSPGSAGRGRSPSPLAGATEVPGVTGPEQRRNGRSGPAASAARAGRERPARHSW